MQTKHKLNHSLFIFGLAILLFVLIVFAQQAIAQNLDTTFNAGVTETNATISATAVQPDGKIIAVGNFLFVNGNFDNNMIQNSVVRFNADGSLDNSFNPGGTGQDGNVYAVVLQPDGKIIIAGSIVSYNNVAKGGIVRLNPDGTLDTTFNTNGEGTNTGFSLVYNLGLQADGKIVIAGQFSSYNGTTQNSVARLNSDGTLDTTFTSGFAASEYVESVAVQPDGKVLIGGFFEQYGGVNVKQVDKNFEVFRKLKV